MYFKAIDSLRFFAAFLVILSHGYQSVVKLGKLDAQTIPILFKGGEAVDFFFTLSGFLITYLLLNELEKTGAISIRNFYVRRVLRIWPLYFVCVAAGFVGLGIVYPAVMGETYFNFDSIWVGLGMFLLFLPNLAVSLSSVGVLYPLWSIGVEEQFYIIWAPLLSYFKTSFFYVVCCVAVLSFMLALTNELDLITDNKQIHKFIGTLKFHCMGIGGIFAYAFYGVGRFPLLKKLESSRIQLFILSLIIINLFASVSTGLYSIDDVIMSTLYGCLIVGIALGVKMPVLENRILLYLGQISFGLYMLHMFVDYSLRFTFPQLQLALTGWGFFFLYLAALTLITIAIASVSYFFFEKHFLKLKHHFE